MLSIWKHFERTEDADVARCIACRKKFMYNIQSLELHLIRVHCDELLDDFYPYGRSGINATSSTPVTDNNKRKHEDEAPESSKKVKSSPTQSPSVEETNPLITPSMSEATSSTTSTTEQRTSETGKEKHRRQTIIDGIANLIVEDLLPLSFVEGDGFRKLIKIAESDYAQLSRADVESRINSLYDSKKAEIQQSLQNARYVSLTVDVWNCKSKEHFITVTCHFIDDEWKMKTHALHTVPTKTLNTGNFRKKMDQVIEEYEIIADKIVATTHHNAPYIANAFKNYKKLGSSVTCFAHTIQYCLSKGLGQNDQELLNSVLKKCSSLVDYIKYLNKASQALLDYQIKFNLTQNKLVQMVPERWNSTYLMLDRIREQRSAIEAILNNREITSFESSKNYKLTEDEWKLINQLTDVLEPFQTAVSVISQEQYSTASIIIPFVTSFINNYLKSDPTGYDNVSGNQTSAAGKENELDDIAAYQKILKSEFRKHLTEIPNSSEDPLVLVTFLDPRYKTSVQNDPNLHEMIKKEITSTQPDVQNRNDAGKPNYNTLFQSPTSYQRDELKAYLIEKEIPQVQNPLIWWKKNSSKYPALSKLAKKYLCIPATSVPPEWIFSSAGDTIMVKRSCLPFDNAEKLTFLHHNK